MAPAISTTTTNRTPSRVRTIFPTACRASTSMRRPAAASRPSCGSAWPNGRNGAPSAPRPALPLAPLHWQPPPPSPIVAAPTAWAHRASATAPAAVGGDRHDRLGSGRRVDPAFRVGLVADAGAVDVKAPLETILVTGDEAGLRLDRWFRLKFPEVGYSYLQKLLRSGQVRVDSRRAQANWRLEAGQQVRVPQVVRTAPRPRASPIPPLGLSKADRQFVEAMILFEDEHVLVLDKPFGIAVQGGTGTKRHLDGLLRGIPDRFGDRPRLVHRLDRDTTGVLLVAKHRQAAAKLGRIFQTRSAAKTYWALVKGVPRPPQGKVEAALVKAAGTGGERGPTARPGG